MPNPAIPIALTPQQVADRLQVSVRTVRRLIARGEIEAVRVGNQLRVPSRSLDAYLDSHRVSPK